MILMYLLLGFGADHQFAFCPVKAFLSSLLLSLIQLLFFPLIGCLLQT